jgi:hypothetical protein
MFSFLIPRALKKKVIEILNNRIKRGILKKSEDPYRNPWFLAKKKDKISYRLINAAIEMNCHNLLGCIAAYTSRYRRGIYCNRKHGSQLFKTGEIEQYELSTV